MDIPFYTQILTVPPSFIATNKSHILLRVIKNKQPANVIRQ